MTEPVDDEDEAFARAMQEAQLAVERAHQEWLRDRQRFSDLSDPAPSPPDT